MNSNQQQRRVRQARLYLSHRGCNNQQQQLFCRKSIPAEKPISCSVQDALRLRSQRITYSGLPRLLILLLDSLCFFFSCFFLPASFFFIPNFFLFFFLLLVPSTLCSFSSSSSLFSAWSFFFFSSSSSSGLGYQAPR